MISLLIPFASADPIRTKIFEWVHLRWQRLFPEWEIVLGESDTGDFNRSQARNAAFAASTGDIIVLSDADTACNPTIALNAIAAVESGAPWIIAHDRYYSLTKEYTRWLIRQPPENRLVQPFEYDWVMKEKSQAGVIVMPREAWEAIGGYNEDFKGWGYEDNEFAVRLDRKWGEHERIKGSMVHLWHPRGDADFDQPHIRYNEDLYYQTVRAA